MIPKNILNIVPFKSESAAVGITMLTLVLAGVMSRFWIADFPNFKPIASIALFTGFLFGRRWFAALVPLGMLLISDFFLGFYEWPIMLAVYGSGMFGWLLGSAVRRASSHPSWRGRDHLRINLAVVLMSLVFFITTNFAVWMCGWYATTWDGLLFCFAAGLPFFKWTILSDLLFSNLLFAIYAVGVQWVHVSNREPAWHGNSAQSHSDQRICDSSLALSAEPDGGFSSYR
jgi:hypothetical protein